MVSANLQISWKLPLFQLNVWTLASNEHSNLGYSWLRHDNQNSTPMSPCLAVALVIQRERKRDSRNDHSDEWKHLAVRSGFTTARASAVCCQSLKIQDNSACTMESHSTQINRNSAKQVMTSIFPLQSPWQTWGFCCCLVSRNCRCSSVVCA